MTETWFEVCIPLTRGQHTIIDVADYEAAIKYKWYALPSRNGKFYASTAVYEDGKQRRISLHQVVLEISGRSVIGDHINGNSLDNRRSNLRKTNFRGNNLNTGIRRNNKTGFKGVSYVQNRFRVNIAIDGKQIFVGGFDNPVSAARAYDKAAKRLHGEFARLNFPQGSTHGQ